MSEKLKWDNKVILVTGGGRGIGREYCKFFASRGAKVVVNDSGVDLLGENPDPQVAQSVVQEIVQSGGIAVSNSLCVSRGKEIVDFVIKTFGRIDIIINNAGILCDVSFQKMTNNEWNKVLTTHLQGTFSICHAAWNVMREQQFGRIVNTVSGSGLYGSFGQANYSAAKLAILGLSYTLAREGEKRNILVNAIAPVAASRMTSTVLPQKILDKLHPVNIVPFVAFLTHETCTENGSVFELGAGYVSKLRLQRSKGAFFDLPFSPEEVKQKIGEINDFSINDYPESSTDIFKNFFKNIERIQKKKQEEAKQQEERKLKQQEQQQQQQQVQSNSNLKSAKIFDLMAKFLELGEGKDIVAEVQGTYNFGIYLEKGQDPIETWIIDLKNGDGSVQIGTLPTADASFFMSDNDFVELCHGNLDPQQAFLTGKMKIKGNLKKATVFTPELFPQPTEENFQKYMNQQSKGQSSSSSSQESAKKRVSTGLASEKIFDLLDGWLKTCANLSENEEQSPMQIRKLVNATYIFQITKEKGGDIIASFKVNLKDLPMQCQQVPVEETQCDAIFILIDQDFVDICNDKLDPQQAFLEGKMKIKGNMKKATLFTPDLFPPPTPENFAKYLKAKL